MKRNAIVCGLLVMFAASCLVAIGDDDKPKYTIKEVMNARKKDKLHEKFQKGQATKEEKETLTEGYEAMGKSKPPKGDEKDWKTKIDALLKAIKDDDKDGFKKANDCGKCHGAHKKS